jgi:hypothetical protein
VIVHSPDSLNSQALRVVAIAALVDTLPMPIAEEIVPHIATSWHIEDQQ